jgi:hypothetical protein
MLVSVPVSDQLIPFITAISLLYQKKGHKDLADIIRLHLRGHFDIITPEKIVYRR